MLNTSILVSSQNRACNSIIGNSILSKNFNYSYCSISLIYKGNQQSLIFNSFLSLSNKTTTNQYSTIKQINDKNQNITNSINQLQFTPLTKQITYSSIQRTNLLFVNYYSWDLQSLWETAKHEAKHYWNGTKLFAKEVQSSTAVVSKITKGKDLTRREKKLLQRTGGDVVKIVPVGVLVAIPFMELLIPVLLRVFPNMLPSTFETKSQKEARLKKKFEAKLEMTSFLQDVVENMAKTKQTKNEDFQFDLTDFMSRVRSGEYVSNKEIVSFVKLFSDTWKLNKLPRNQLAALCTYVGLPTFGPINFLRAQLEIKLHNLKKDDLVIRKEGVDELNFVDLQKACLERGIKVLNVPEEELKLRLHHWLKLSLDEKLEPSLILLSRALAFTNPIKQRTKKEKDDLKKNEKNEKIIKKQEKDDLKKTTTEDTLSKDLIKSDKEENAKIEKENKEELKKIEKQEEDSENSDSDSEGSKVEDSLHDIMHNIQIEIQKVKEKLGDRMNIEDKDVVVTIQELEQGLHGIKTFNELNEEETLSLIQKIDNEFEGSVNLKSFAKLVSEFQIEKIENQEKTAQI